jgi:hypothetical protein
VKLSGPGLSAGRFLITSSISLFDISCIESFSFFRTQFWSVVIF